MREVKGPTQLKPLTVDTVGWFPLARQAAIAVLVKSGESITALKTSEGRTAAFQAIRPALRFEAAWVGFWGLLAAKLLSVAVITLLTTARPAFDENTYWKQTYNDVRQHFSCETLFDSDHNAYFPCDQKARGIVAQAREKFEADLADYTWHTTWFVVGAGVLIFIAAYALQSLLKIFVQSTILALPVLWFGLHAVFSGDDPLLYAVKTVAAFIGAGIVFNLFVNTEEATLAGYGERAGATEPHQVRKNFSLEEWPEEADAEHPADIVLD